MPRSSRRPSSRRLKQKRKLSRKSKRRGPKRGGSVALQRRFSDPETCQKRIEELKSAIWRLEMDKKSVQSPDSIQAIQAQIDDLKIRVQTLLEASL